MIQDPVLEQDEKELTDEAVVEKPAEVVEEELNPYKEQMAQLAVENRQKTGALKEAKEKVKTAEEKAKELEERLKALEENKEEVKPKSKYLSPEEADKLMTDKIKQQRLEDLIVKSTSNLDEQKLVRYHLDNSIVKTGDVEQDLSMAIAIANKHLVDQAKSAEVERLNREAMNAQFSGGRSYSRQGTPSWQADPIKKEANELLKKLGVHDGEKYL